jgi:glucose/arabinose dehydrogenase
MIRTTLLAAIFTSITANLTLAESFSVTGSAGTSLSVEEIATFNEPWAMAFLPDGRMLVTDKSGELLLLSAEGKQQTKVSGVPEVDYGGQGGMGDVVLHPGFVENNMIYLSYAEKGKGSTRGAVVVRARLIENDGEASLQNLEVIWEQIPKVTGRGHYSHRIAFAPDGKLFITSGDRQKLDPAQDYNSSLGKLIRLNEDGSVPDDNPFQDKGELAKTFWSLGHRNLLGIAFDKEGRLWQTEMGPRNGDELNLNKKAANYGWPLVSEGSHYSGFPIPSHKTRSEFEPPKAYWVPSIAPSGLVIYQGSVFPEWNGDAFIGGLASQALIRVDIVDEDAKEAERFEWGERIREVEQGPDDALYVLEDGGRLLRLTPQ